MLFRQLYDAESSTYTYLLADPETRDAVIIDPVIEQADRDVELLRELGLTLRHVLDTHVHADHVTAASTLRDRLGCKTVVSEHAGVGCADMLVKEGDSIQFGGYGLDVRETPGHTSTCLTFVTRDRAMAFTGDALLIRGCGRTDFQQGDSRALYRSVHGKIFDLPETTLIYPGHDYKGRTVTSTAEERAFNPRLGGDKTEDEFVDIMSKLEMAYPKKIDEALPRNLRCGRAVQAADPSLVCAWGPITSQAGVPEVSPEWVRERQDEIRLVDVRERAELVGALGRIEGVEHVPLASLPGPLVADDPRLVVTVCRSGVRSVTAARLLLDRGFPRVASMRGGMTAWNKQHLPVLR